MDTVAIARIVQGAFIASIMWLILFFQTQALYRDYHDKDFSSSENAVFSDEIVYDNSEFPLSDE